MKPTISFIACVAWLILAFEISAQNISGIVNTYVKVIDIDTCFRKIVVNTSSGFLSGDLVLLIQMNGAQIDTSNSSQFGSIVNFQSGGLYEYGRIDTVIGNDIFLQSMVINQYQPLVAAVQLIRVPEYQNATVTNTVTCPAWDGNTGGVIALNVDSTLELNANINASAKGFHGGIGISVNWQCTKKDFFYSTPDRNGAMKGEGIAILPSNKLYGRGAPANGGGGGNSTNTGGGGGGLGGTGGLGGYQWGSVNNSNSCFYNDPNPNETPGVGGRSLHTQIPQRAIMGGGGGAGDANDNVPSDGGIGGGIILIQTNTLIGNGNQIIANGQNGVDPIGLANEGGGGGGSGGMVWLNIDSLPSNITLSVTGGRGANVRNHGGNHGPGGGGGGGLIRITQTLIGTNVTLNLNGGIAGIMTNNSGDPWGAQPGQIGHVEESDPFIIPIADTGVLSTVIACIGDTVTLSVPFTNVDWLPNQGLSCTNCNNPTVVIGLTDTVFYFEHLNNCNIWILDSIEIQIEADTTTVLPVSFTACLGDTITIYSGTTAQVRWLPILALSCTNCNNPDFIVNAQDSFVYYEYLNNCDAWILDSVSIFIQEDTVTVLPVSFTACEGDTIMLHPGTTNQVRWLPISSLSCINCSNPNFIVNIHDSIIYYEYLNTCEEWVLDSVSIYLQVDSVTTSPVSFSACVGDTITLHPGTTTQVRWLAHTSLSCTNCSNPDFIVNAQDSVVYYEYQNNCIDWILDSVTLSIQVDTTTVNPVSVTACIGDTIPLQAGTSVQVRWMPIPPLSCTNCSNPDFIVNAQDSVVYYEYFNDCNKWIKDSISVIIELDTTTVTPISFTACIGDTIRLQAGTSVQVRWMPIAALSCTNCNNPDFIVNILDSVVYYEYLNNCNHWLIDSVVIAIQPDTTTVTPVIFTACIGDTITLHHGTNTPVRWLPNPNLSCTSCNNPVIIVGPTDSIVFYEYLNTCKEWIQDSVLIRFIISNDSVIPQTFTGCDRDTLSLFAGIIAQVVWYPHPALSCTNCSNPDYILSLGDSILYFEYLNICNRWVLDSVFIEVNPRNSFVPHQSFTACEGETLAIFANVSPVRWLPNQSLSCINCDTTTITVKRSDTVIFYEYFKDCKDWVLDSVTIQVTPDTITVSPMIFYGCEGAQITLSPGTSTSVLWYPNQGLSCINCRNPTHDVTKPDYYVHYEYLNNCNVWILDSVLIEEIPDTFSATPVRIKACHGDTLTLVAGTSAPIQWQPHHLLDCTNCPNPTIIADTQHYLFIYNYRSGCDNWYIQSVVIDFEDGDCYPCTLMVLPNAFTPNGDGLNDVFKPLAEPPSSAQLEYFRIYNRWGELVFETSVFQDGWDGTYNGELATPGVYTWIVNGRCGKNDVLESGNVTLIR